MTSTQGKSGSPAAKKAPKKAPKRKKAPRRRTGTAKAAKPNGAAPAAAPNGKPPAASPEAPAELRPVGHVVSLGPDDIATLQAMRTVRDDHQQHLGLEREAYLSREVQRLEALRKASQEYESIVLAVAKKHGAAVDGQSWRYEPEQQAFVRTG